MTERGYPTESVSPPLTVRTLLRRLRFEGLTERWSQAKAGFTLSVDGGMPMRVTAR